MSTEDRYSDRLSEYLDGDLEAREHADVEAHLRTCADCRATLADLRRIAAQAASAVDEAPARDLWPGIQSRIGGPSPGRATIHVFRDAARRRFSFTLPQIAAASLALMVLSGSMAWMARAGNSRMDFPPASAEETSSNRRVAPARFADVEFEAAVADLEEVLEAGRSTLDPQTIAVLEENLRAIDDAIDQSRRALAQDPANAYLNSHLAKARQRKLTLLRRASSLATAGS